MRYCVLDIGGTWMKYASMEEDGTICSKGKVATPLDSLEQFWKVLDTLIQNDHKGVAISFPGPVDAESGIILEGGSLGYMKQVALASEITKRYGLACSIENDARCAALAEVWKGNLKDIAVGMVVVFGTGIGSSLTINGSVFKGAHAFAGEISCLITKDIDALGWQASFHHDAGIPFLLKKVQAAKQVSSLDGMQFFQLLENGDDIAWQYFRSYCAELAKQFYNMQCMVDPQRICIGGGVSVQPLFLSELQTALDAFYARIPIQVPKPELVPCKFHNDANLIGALYHFHQIEKTCR